MRGRHGRHGMVAGISPSPIGGMIDGIDIDYIMDVMMLLFLKSLSVIIIIITDGDGEGEGREGQMRFSLPLFLFSPPSLLSLCMPCCF